MQGPGTREGPLDSMIYRVKILKIGKISFFLLTRAPLGKNRSQAPAHMYMQMDTLVLLNICNIQDVYCINIKNIITYVECR